MINKVIYINYQPITSKYYSDYYIDKCIENGIDVEYWDVSKWYFPEVVFNSDFDFKNIIYIKSSKEFKKQLSIQVLGSTFFVTNITYEFRAIKLFLDLSSLNCKKAFFARGMHPLPETAKSRKLSKIILSFNFRKLLVVIENRIALLMKKVNLVKPYDYIFRAGSSGGLTIGYGSDYDLGFGKIREINYFDYDKYQTIDNSELLIEGKYCLFIDQYLASHPDIAICGLENVNPKQYYFELNNYFDYIELKYRVTVVIAAHPKAVDYITSNPFFGRKIVFNKTCELVKDAEFVMTHHSTAISFPILFKKPIIFLNSLEIKRAMPFLYDLTNFLANYLNTEVVDLNNFEDNKELNLNVNLEIYNNYKYKFLTSKESESQLTSDIFIKTLLSL
ncbi:hypothetical protein LPB248_14530 [Flavobacterium sp. LPB0248]|uniref:hypothetical protein n=1 Tax=Flavobacterium sp. LPB0248 TaxID=2614441 RepID=UPI0015A55434|nr:hypothetical protein [Flavobacterium sp. LPB0248]QLC67474.1 hypothetical protein LPB248_14530 [Flavobacterium sp. LPB0248]